MMISLLDSGSHEIVYTACGVLINMMVDCDRRSVLKEEGGIKKYVVIYVRNYVIYNCTLFLCPLCFAHELF